MSSTASVGAYEAKTHLPRLLDQVARGETVTITRHGRPVARLVPVTSGVGAAQAVTALRAFRQGKRLGSSVREAIEAGRP